MDFLEGSLTVTLDLTLDGYPDTQAVLTFNRTALKDGDALLSLVHGSETVTFKVERPATDITKITVTSPGGAALVVTYDESASSTSIYGIVTVSGGSEVVGEIHDSGLGGSAIIRYSDGTFESLW